MSAPRSFLFVFLSLFIAARAAEPFEIKEGDRILLLGDALLERENSYGTLELRMHEQFPDRKFSVRNLSWAGETPRGISRASFDPPEKGFERLKEQIALVKPTVVFLGFGMAASLQEMTDRAHDWTLNPDPARYGREPMSAGRFKRELGELMDAIGKDARFVLLSPIRHEDLRATRPGLPDPAAHNQLLTQYGKAIEELAKERGARFVNLADVEGQLWHRGYPITDNGIHPDARGFGEIVGATGISLGWERNTLAAGARPQSAILPAILRKNALWFHRTRPANETYLFGFRKHEQGQNAKEIPQFDPLVEQADAEIDRLKRGKAETSNAQRPTPNAQPAPQTDKPPLPSFDLGENLEISLWAADPLLVKPTQMNWDALGRLWVCGTAHYPQIAPGEIEKDQIFILEDTDGDGKADKSTPFAGGMLMPTCIVPDWVPSTLEVERWKLNVEPAAGAGAVRKRAPKSPPLPGAERSTSNVQRPTFKQNACYVGASTELLHFADTDGDGIADQKRIVFSGFGTEDTHHNVHTLKWGPNGRLYFNQSVYTHTHLETPHGMVRLNAGGVFAYDPRTERVEVFSKGLWNPWGHVIDRHGQHFLTDGAGRDGIAWAFPGAVFAPSEGARQTMPLISPGTYPKFAGLEFITSPHFPDDWQDTVVTCDFRAHRVVRFKINDLSAGEGSAQKSVLSAQTPAAKSPRSTEHLALSTSAKSGYITSELPDLARTADLTFRPIDAKLGPDGALYIADWTNPVINHGEVDFRDPRRDKTSGRIWRITYKGRPTVKFTPPPSQPPVSDDSPRGRIAQMRALAKTPTVANVDKILGFALDAPADDPYYAFAAWRSMNDVTDAWVEAVLAGQWSVASAVPADGASGTAHATREKQLEYALKAIEPALAGRVLAQLVHTGKAPLDGSGPWPELIALAGGAKELRALFDAFVGGKITAAAEPRVLAALVDAARNRNLRPEGDLAPALAPLRARLNEPAAVRLLGLWKLTDPMTEIAALAREAKTPQPVRDAAFDALKAYGDASALRLLEEMTRPEFPLGLRRHAMLTIAQTNFQAGFVRAKEVLRDITNPDEALQTWRALLAINGAPVAFAHRMPKDLPQPIYAAGLRAAREVGRKGQELVAVLTPLAGASAAPVAPVDYSALVAETLSQGDPAAGEEVYRRAGLACTTCHAIGGAGGKVGPELGTIGASAPLDYIIESLLDPGAKVKEGYNAVSLTQKDGAVAMGVVVRESAADIVLRTATGQEQTIAKELVKQKDNLGSLMPPGLLEPLKPREKLNLYAFLAQLGKKGVYDASRGHIARVWWLGEKQGAPGAAAVLTNVDGRLPRERLAESLAIFPGAPAVFATAKLTAAAPLKTQLLLTGVREAWLDGQPLAVASEPAPAIELSAGDHTLTVKLDPRSLPEVLRAEAAGARFLTE